MDRNELRRVFDQLTPPPGRERELLRQLLQEDVRRTKPVKNWKQIVAAAAAAVLLVTGAAAAVVLPRIDPKILDHLNVDPENSEATAEAADLLYPGAMALDIVKEDNGATLHVTQILRDRYTVMILADFTAPEGTQFCMGEADPPGISTFKGFANGSREGADFLDGAGEPMGADGLVGFYSWNVLEDDDPMDNHLSLMFTLAPQHGEDAVWAAASLRVPAVNLAYYDRDQQREVTVYSGDWSFDAPLPQKDIGWVVQVDQVLGELDGAAITVQGELYLSPITLKFDRRRDGGADFYGPLDAETEAMVSRWYSLGKAEGVTLTGPDGTAASVDYGSGSGGFGENLWEEIYRLKQVTDPAKFQGGALTLDWACGKAVISLDGLAPVEP